MKKSFAVVACVVLSACGGGDGARSVDGMVFVKKGSVPGPGACGVSNAYEVTQAAGVHLSQPAVLTREAAETLNHWLATEAIPAFGRRGGGLAAIQVPSHYACRTRNSRPGAKLSEHAKGRAIDISAFILADGTRVSVLTEWNGDYSGIMRRLHSSACGPFGTVLGPNSDVHHRDHFHFDIAQHRGGAYCR